MKWTDDFLDQKRQEADPLADELLRKLIEEQGLEASKQLFDKLITNIELPKEELPIDLQEFLDATVSLPSWFSREDMQDSNRFFIDHGPTMLVVLYYKSLPVLYSDVKGAGVLTSTSRLTSEDKSLAIFARRIAETGQFLLDVMANDHFTTSEKAVNAIRKVRLIHAAIRQFLKPHWDIEKNGQPINQEDMALTLMTFSISMIDGLEQLSVPLDERMSQAFFERWRAIGLLLGVDPDMIPKNSEEGRQLTKKVLDRVSGPSDAGKILTSALIKFSKDSIPGKIFDITPESLIYFFNGKELAEHLGVSERSGCLGVAIPSVMAKAFSSIERLENKSDRIEYVSNQLSKKLISALVKYFDTYKQRRFSVPEEFQVAWKIDK